MRNPGITFFCILLATLTLAAGVAAGPSIHLRYASFDPLVGEPEISPDLRSHPVPGKLSYYLVQFRGPIEPTWTSELGSLGAELLDYIPSFAFIVRMTPEVARRASGLEQIRWVGPFHAAYRLGPKLINLHGPTKVTVQLFPGESRAAVEAEVRRGRGVVLAGGSGPGGEYLEALVPLQAVRRIARRQGVSWIEPRLERKLCNDVARGIMNVPPVWAGMGLFGTGEIVAVCDTGLDTGNLSTISADFAGRILETYDLGRKKKWDDPVSHGTHVAGSVLGSGVLSGSNPPAHDYEASFAGVAPEAQLVFQSVLDNSGNLRGIPLDLNDLFQPPYDDGARIHSNSWGAPYAGAYTTDSRNLDMFTWNHQDMTILTSAGNDARDADSDGVVDPDSLGSPATAKNCITVGGSENYRLSGGAQGTYGSYWPSDFPADPINSDKVSDNWSGMVAFSSRGPCNDGRLKPDICAPGTNVISCRSHVVGSDTLWGVYNADYLYSGGTSMSTPLVAGASALVREYYRTQRSHIPSAALIKGTLINGALELSPGQYGTGPYFEIPVRPNNVEGWGLVDLTNSIVPSGLREIQFVDYTPGLSTGGSEVYNYAVTDSSSPFCVTLVWTDYPASTSASQALVNDLDLVVTLPDSSVLTGNGTTDRLNNVEGVDVNSPPTGDYTVTVSAYNVPNGPQPFALVVSGDMGVSPPTAIIDSPTDGTTLFGAVTIRGTASGIAFQQYTLEFGVGASPSSWTPIGPPQTAPVTDGVLGTWDTSALANDTYTIRLTVTSTSGTSTDQATVDVLETSLSQIKDNPDGAAVTLTGKVVSAGPAEFGTTMYVQEPDRSSGLKIDLGAVPTDAIIGSIVTVIGTLQTSSGERTVTNPTVTVTGSGPEPIPLSIINRDVGGSALNAYTPGVTGGVGLHNLGLLICTWGRVTAIETDYFYMDDGSALLDGSGETGVKVYTGDLTEPALDEYAVVTGISSAEISGSDTRRLVRPRRQSDLAYY